MNRGGADGVSHSPGFAGKLTTVNTPTVLTRLYPFEAKLLWNQRLTISHFRTQSLINSSTYVSNG
jgi:hypothetical protein